MNDLQLKDDWHVIKDKVQSHCSLLNRDDIEKINGEYTTLISVLVEKYKKTKEEVEQEVGFFLLEQKSNPQQ